MAGDYPSALTNTMTFNPSPSADWVAATSFHFTVRLGDAFDLGTFTKVEGLGVEVDVEKREEGGQNAYVHQLPGRAKYQNIKVSRHVNEHSGYVAHLFSETNGSIHPTLTIEALRPDDSKALATWTMQKVLLVKWTGPSFANDSATALIETLEFAHHGFAARDMSASEMLGVITEQDLKKAELLISEPKLAGKTLGVGKEIEVFTFQFNPKEYTVQTKAQWDSKQHKKGVVPPQYKGVSPSTMSLEAFLDQRLLDKGQSVEKLVGMLLQCTQPTKESLKSKPYPPVLTFSWGKTRQFTGVSNSVSAKFTMFASDGAPLRAAVTIGLQVFDLTWPKQNPTSGAPRIDRSRQMKLGDSLASIAYEEYGDPNLWRAVALANRLPNPQTVPPGTHLLLPPLNDAVQLLRDAR